MDKLFFVMMETTMDDCRHVANVYHDDDEQACKRFAAHLARHTRPGHAVFKVIRRRSLKQTAVFGTISDRWGDE